jgi:hypothetical protein
MRGAAKNDSIETYISTNAAAAKSIQSRKLSQNKCG